MRLTALTVIAALGLVATAVSARATPLVPDLDARHSPNIVQVWGGCGPGGRPVPGHWNRWRGGWVPPHCAPGYRPYGPYAGGWRRYGYRYW
jgi:hypothetical protein